MKKFFLFIVLVFALNFVLIGCDSSKELEITTKYSIKTPLKTEDYEVSVSDITETDDSGNPIFVENSEVRIIVELNQKWSSELVELEVNGIKIDKKYKYVDSNDTTVHFTINQILEDSVVEVKNLVKRKMIAYITPFKTLDGKYANREILEKILLSDSKSKNFQLALEYLQDGVYKDSEYGNTIDIYLMLEDINSYDVENNIYFIMKDPNSNVVTKKVKFLKVTGEINMYKVSLEGGMKKLEYSLFIDNNNEFGEVENKFDILFPNQNNYFDLKAIDEDFNEIDKLEKKYSKAFMFILERKEEYLDSKYDKLFEDLEVRVNGSLITEIDLKGKTVYIIKEDKVPASFLNKDEINKFIITTNIHYLISELSLK